MTKKELRRILKNLCEYKCWTLIRPTVFIDNTQTVLIADVYDKSTGSIYDVYVDTKSGYYTYQFLSPFNIHSRNKNSLDRFM